jgi:hypothetical protein
VEKISIQLIVERDGGYESGASWDLTGADSSRSGVLLTGCFVSKTVHWKSGLTRQKFPQIRVEKYNNTFFSLLLFSDDF